MGVEGSSRQGAYSISFVVCCPPLQLTGLDQPFWPPPVELLSPHYNPVDDSSYFEQCFTKSTTALGSGSFAVVFKVNHNYISVSLERGILCRSCLIVTAHIFRPCIFFFRYAIVPSACSSLRDHTVISRGPTPALAGSGRL